MTLYVGVIWSQTKAQVFSKLMEFWTLAWRVNLLQDMHKGTMTL